MSEWVIMTKIYLFEAKIRGIGEKKKSIDNSSKYNSSRSLFSAFV